MNTLNPLLRLMVLSLVLFALLPLQAQANKLLMPGEVIKGHAKEEEACEKCHKKFDKAAQNRLCSDCHKDVGKDVAAKKGYHGRLDEGKECKECHTDHKGRDEKIAEFDHDKFEHDKTDFALKHKHAESKVKCEDCHKKGKKFREAPGYCNDCHKKDDDKAHKGGLGTDCAKCHNEKDWKKAVFDHGKTKFDLRGKHADAKCDKCHLDGKYKKTPKECVACHKKEDDKAHKGKMGKKCESCHVDRDWKEIKFDHDKLTKYPLLGKHADVKCDKCHIDKKYKDTPKTCNGCHRKDDEKAHKGKYGNKCESCHTEKDWKETRFDHDKQTKYPLIGKHADPKLKCSGCHKGDLYKDKLKTDCYSCHEKDDKHKGQEGKKCESCHNERDWKKTSFNHNRMSKFPLLGGHALVECKKCHAGPTFKDAKSDCWSCHKKDDDKTHKQRFGTECQECHTVRDWKAWDFDHDRTDFRLGAAHKEVGCYKCHDRPVQGKVQLANACGSCHDRDDVHNGSYGDQCQRCHDGNKWSKIKIGVKVDKRK